MFKLILDLTKIAELLLEKEIIHHEDLEKILGVREGLTDDQRKYLKIEADTDASESKPETSEPKQEKESNEQPTESKDANEPNKDTDEEDKEKK